MNSLSADIRSTRTIRLRTAPSWLPEKYRTRTERVVYKVRMCAGERRFLRRRKHEMPSEWAPKNRVVTYGPLEGSRWDNDFMPHMRGVMDASFYPSVRYIGNCKGPQTGSSAGAETCLGYIADLQPGPAFIVYPKRDTAADRSTDYLQPMFKKSPRLKKLLTGSSDDMASLRIKLQTMLIYMGWAGSVTSLGNISARYLVGDEIDKWVEQATKKEANTLKLFFERFRSYKYGAKCWLISTPTTPDGPIWKYMQEEAQVVFEYHIPCPACGEYHRMEFRHVKWPEDVRDPKVLEEQRLASYCFPCCGLVATDVVRIEALKRGRWHERISEERIAAGESPRELFAVLREDNPRKICFHSPGWVSPLVSHAEMAASFLRGLKDPKEMQYFDTQIAAKAHVPYRQNRREDTIMSLRDDRPAGLVPGGGIVQGLVAGVDTQDNSFVFSIRAFGWGIAQQSWQIRKGEVDSLAALEQVLFHDAYRDADGLYYPVHLAVIDSGGHRASEVYDFARRHPSRVAAYKGASGRRGSPHSRTIIDRYPGTSTPIPGGVELYICDTHHYKDMLSAKLRIAGDDPGSYLFHQEIDLDFAGQLCAEYVDDRRLWQCPKGRANHFWDCAVMELVAADLMQFKYRSNESGDA